MIKFILGLAIGAVITGALTYNGGKFDYNEQKAAGAMENAKNFYNDVKSSISE